MTPGARIAAAIDVLDQVFDGAPAEQALTRWARGARYAGSKDRAAVRDHVFQALRCRRSFGVLGGGTDGRAVMIGALRSDQIDPATRFTGDGHAPPCLSEVEIRTAHQEMSAADAADLPDWLWSVFIEDLGENALAMAQAQRARAPIALRVNLKISSVDQAIDILMKDGIECHSTEGCVTALIVAMGARKIRHSAAYLEGAVELQDVSSQAAMARIALPDRARVLDYCAGGGGKTLALAALAPADVDAQFFAHDADPARMVDLPARSARAGVSVVCLSGAELRQSAAFDVVLCDVPCTGSGTWRRTPDSKWRLTEQRLSELLEIQKDILRSSSHLVRPGGQLIYTTCSVLSCENSAQIARFCADHTAFSLEEDIHWPVSDEGDGFYFAAMRCG